MVSKARTPIVSLSDFDESINLMLYGPSGCGKSVVAGTAPNALFIGTEQGQISAKRAGSTADLWPCPTWSEFEAATKWLEDGGHSEYEWAILDSWTSMQMLAWKHIIEQGALSKPQRDIDLPEIQEHFKMQQMMRRVCTKYVGMQINTIHIAQTMASTTDEGEDLSLPQINGKQGDIAQFVMGQMSSIGHMMVVENDEGEKVRRIFWDFDPPHAGRDRYGCLGPYTDDTTIPKITKKIKASGTESTASTTRRRSTRSGTARRSRTTRKAAS